LSSYSSFSDYRRYPFTHVDVILTPAKHLDRKGNPRKCNILTDHKPLRNAPQFYSSNLGIKSGEVALLSFIEETVTYKKEEDEREAIRLANWRPFVTPLKPEEPPRSDVSAPLPPPRHILAMDCKSYSWMKKDPEETKQENGANDGIAAQVDRDAELVAERAIELAVISRMTDRRKQPDSKAHLNPLEPPIVP
jgi:hypothetical protein